MIPEVGVEAAGPDDGRAATPAAAAPGLRSAPSVTLLSPRVTPFHSRNAGRHAVAVEPDAGRLNAGGEAARTMLDTLARVMRSRDGATAAHARRVQEYASALTREVCAADEILLEAVQMAALLHDIGKLAIPDRLLHKPGPLTREEYEQVKLHAVIGADMLGAIDFPGPLAPIVRHHHENWDGSGYPDGLSGEEIPFGARLLAIVDCYDALTSERPYRKGLPHDRALRMIAERRSTGFDPAVCDAFLRVVQGLRTTAAPPPQDVVPPYAFRLNVPRLV
jgi:putative nucleotidyltransferase with HDIG domain